MMIRKCLAPFVLGFLIFTQNKETEEVETVPLPKTCISKKDDEEEKDYYDDNIWYVNTTTDCESARECGLDGIWFPEGPPLFRPFAADPREITYSLGWRFNDKVVDKNVIDFSFGDILPIFR